MTKDPDFKRGKLSSWCPRHDVGRCRREFVLAAIVGPADKPFAPNVSKIDGDALVKLAHRLADRARIASKYVVPWQS